MTDRPDRLAALAALDAVAYVVIRPAPAATDSNLTGTFGIEAASHGMSKTAAAYALRQVADRFDAAAAAAGEQPLDAVGLAEADARNAPTTPPAAAEDDTPTGQKYPCGIGVNCDRCDTEVRSDYIVTDTMTKPERLQVARDYLRSNAGWSGDGDVDYCPDCTKANAAEAQRPAVGDRYVSRHVSRTVTVTRVWDDGYGTVGVKYEWRDDRPGLCESACPVDVFHRAYRAEAQPTPPVTACTHGYILMQDSCPGCDAEQETPHTADPVAILPRWAPRGMIRCRRCSLAPSHRIHHAEAQR